MSFTVGLEVVDWDFDRFSEAVKIGVKGQKNQEKRRKNLAVFFNMTKMGKIVKPTTIVDQHGRILVWYLPGILCPDRTVSFCQLS